MTIPHIVKENEARVLRHRVPPRFELIGVPHGGGALARSRAAVLDGERLVVAAQLGGPAFLRVATASV